MSELAAQFLSRMPMHPPASGLRHHDRLRTTPGRREAPQGFSWALPATAPSAEESAKTANRSQRLRRLGLRVTASRLGILGLFEESADALSGEQVYALLVKHKIDSSVGTVYRCLHELEDRGVVRREGTAGHKARYRLQREEAEGPRLRFVCGSCGRDRELMDADLHARLLAAAAQAGLPLKAQSLALTLQGQCDQRCALQR